MRLVAIPKKKCTKCGNILPATLEYFSIGKKTNKFGLRAICKVCVSFEGSSYRKLNRERELQRLSTYRANNRDKVLLYGKEYRSNNKDKIKQYYEDNKEKLLERKREYYHTNKESVRESHRQWRSRNRERCAYLGARYRARKLLLKDSFTSEDWEYCKSYFGNSCAYCGDTFLETPHKDHFIPASKGGHFTPDNILCSCKTCNFSKKDSYFVPWYIKQSFYSERRLLMIYEFIVSRRTGDFNEENRNHNVGRK